MKKENTQKNNKIFIPLDDYEKDLQQALEKKALRSISNEKKEIQRYTKIAQNTVAKRKNINLRLSERDLLKLKSIAIKEGIPYQTLLSSVLHKFATGRLTA